jgi:hypothetical protein
MEINISGSALVRLAFWVVLAAVALGFLIGAQSKDAAPTPAPAHPAVEAANNP